MSKYLDIYDCVSENPKAAEELNLLIKVSLELVASLKIAYSYLEDEGISCSSSIVMDTIKAALDKSERIF